MFFTGKSLSSSRILNFSGVNKAPGSRLPEADNMSGILLSSRNKQNNSSVLVQSVARNSSHKHLGVFKRPEPFLKGNSKKCKLKAKK